MLKMPNLLVPEMMEHAEKGLCCPRCADAAGPDHYKRVTRQALSTRLERRDENEMASARRKRQVQLILQDSCSCEAVLACGCCQLVC